jgi:hypothetical protein
MATLFFVKRQPGLLFIDIRKRVQDDQRENKTYKEKNLQLAS